ncbi:vWA domain-containing protein [Neoroseomonas alba]|nr:vWA domain-containing protein [Neoroseomonas alba]
MTSRRLVLLATVALPIAAQAQRPARQPLLIPGKTTLFQRVILRPGATLHAQPGAPQGTPIAGFTVAHVYARRDGWIEIGRDADGRTEGWVRDDRAIDWRHTMIGAFTNPAGRERTMFLRDEPALRELLAAPDMEQQATALRASAGQAGSPVVALEPETFVDIQRNFYLLPILGAETIQRRDGTQMRALEVISAPAELRQAPQQADPARLRDFRGAVVFVIDSTISMQAHIDATREAIRRIIARIGDTAVRDNFRFGMVAYRADISSRPQLEYVTRLVASPDLSQPPAAILPALATVRAATVPTERFDEDAIAGLRVAIDQVDWSGFGGRYVVLITDAGALDATDPKSQTRLGIAEIKALAEARGIALFAIHLLTPEGRANHAHARAQYTELTRAGAAGSLYFPVEGGTPPAFGQVVNNLTNALFRSVADTVGRPIGGVEPARTPAAERIAQQVQIVSTAMRLAYLGREGGTTAPDVVRSFTTDRDLRDPTVAALDVRVLLTRNQLSDLSQALTRILDAGLAGRSDPRSFFGQLRAAFAATARDPARLGNLARVGQALGEYLDGLPYQSQVMELSEQEWLAMGAAAQRELINGIETKLRLYQEFAARPDLWVTLDGRPGGEAFFPVPLEQLP